VTEEIRSSVLPWKKNVSRLHQNVGVYIPHYTASYFKRHSFQFLMAGLTGRAAYGVGLRPFVCWDCGFESQRGHGSFCCVL